jgi:hypothetical protein
MSPTHATPWRYWLIIMVFAVVELRYLSERQRWESISKAISGKNFTFLGA